MDFYTIVVIIIGAALILYYRARLINSGERLDPESFKQKWEQDSGIVIDVRTEGEHNSERLEITDYNFDITKSNFTDKVEQLDHDKNVYLYCRTGSRSGKAARLMEKKGFDKVYNIGGLQDLTKAGFNKQTGN
ncbi:MAG: rhodanese-like domain-containing protein [Balneolaceae bacterium]|nr:rhodanese-like domain-containing protein [Balneolaceae bacterium]